MGGKEDEIFKVEIKRLIFSLLDEKNDHMSTAEMKQELHLLIENADSELLELVYSILRKTENEINLSEIQVIELDRRYENHLKRPHEGSSWDEVKERISLK